MSAEFSKLYRAIMSDNQMVYTELRNSNTDVNKILKETVKHSKDTLLHVAVYWKRHDIAETIIDLQPSLLSEINANGETPLHVAASAGSEDVTRLILDQCRRHQIVTVETGEPILWKKTEKEEDTALHKAVINGHLGVVQLLIDEHPELTKSVNKDGDSPLFMAVDTRKFEIASTILTVSGCSFKGRKNMNALHAAITHRSGEIIMTCLTQNREAELVEQQDENLGWTPLHYAAHTNDTESIQQLVSAEHSVASIKDKNGMTALHIAAKRGHVRAVEKLVELCPEICGIVDDNGQSFFHIAVKRGGVRVVRGLHRQLFADEFLNMQDYEGNTAWQLAALKKDYFILYLMATDCRLSRATKSDGLPVSYRIQPPVITSNKFESPYRRVIMRLVEMTKIKQSEEEVERSKNLREMNLLISTIVATVSFTAALAVPGGFKNGGPDEGTAVLAQKIHFRKFLIFDAIAFGLSATTILIIRNYPSSKIFFDSFTVFISQLATIAMVCAFIFGTTAVLGPSEAKLANSVTFAVVACLSLMFFGAVLLDLIKFIAKWNDEDED